MLLLTWIFRMSIKRPLWIWDIRWRESLIRRLIPRFETEIWVGWLLDFLISLRRWTILRGDIVLDMNMVFSGKLSRMGRKLKYQTIGFSMVTHGKSKESIFNIRFILEEKLEKLSIIRVMKDHIGSRLKLS